MDAGALDSWITGNYGEDSIEDELTIVRHDDGTFTEYDAAGNEVGYGERSDGGENSTVEIFDAIVGTFAICDWTTDTIAPFPPGVAYYGNDVRHMGRDLGTVQSLCDRYNAGVRRI